MTRVESLAADITQKIVAKVNLTVPQRHEITRWIVAEFGPLVPEPQERLSFTDADEKANAAQCAAIIKLLKERRSAGAANHELNALAMKHTSRITDLRQKQNYKIKAVRENGRTWRYFLAPEDW